MRYPPLSLTEIKELGQIVKSIIDNGMPKVPWAIDTARLHAEICISLKFFIDDYFLPLLDEYYTACMRRVNGDDRNDAYFQKVLEGEREKWENFYAHKDAHSLSLQAGREEAERARQEAAAAEEARKSGTTPDSRSWIDAKYLQPLRDLQNS